MSVAVAYTWIKENIVILGLIVSALVGTMPESLPTVRGFPQWAWTWFRDSAKVFLNFRRTTPILTVSVPTKHSDDNIATQRG